MFVSSACDSCVELDVASLAGMAVGEVVATAVVGLAVYLIVSQDRSGRVASRKKSKISVCLYIHLSIGQCRNNMRLSVFSQSLQSLCSNLKELETM